MLKRILLLAMLCAVLPMGMDMACLAADSNSTLWYDKPANVWLEAMPLGNSKLGAMVFGKTDVEEIQLNEETFWSGGPHNNNSASSIYYLNEVRSLIFQGKEKQAEDLINKEFVKGPHGMRFLTLGSLKLDFGHKDVTSYRRELNLNNAVSTVSYTAGGVKYTRETFASLEDGVIVMRIKASGKGKLSFALGHDCKLKSVDNDKYSEVISGKITQGTLKRVIEGVEQEGIKSALKAELMVKVYADGKISSNNANLDIKNATTATIVISAATNFVNYNDVSGNASSKNEAILGAIANLNYDQLFKRHLTKYQAQYNRVSLDLTADAKKQSPNALLPTDQRLDKFYGSDDMGMVALMFNFGRYLLISSSQPGGQAANLQGVWNDKMNAPWDSKYTININAEMNYWPAEVCGLSETAEPLFSMIKDLSVTGAETARKMYGCRGWVAHHNTDIWRVAGPIDGAFWGMFPNGGAWLTTHLWEHYLYTLDNNFLKEYYPILKGAADFYLDYMVERDGELLVVPSVSPEHGGRGKHSPVCAGCTMDNQIVRDALTQAIQATVIMLQDTAVADKAVLNESLASYTAALKKIPQMKVGQYGQLQEWREDIDDPKDEHRHISHLYGLYPSNQISPFLTPDLFKAAGVTLNQRGDQATGWSLGWKTNFWARMLDGNHAFKIISNMLRLLPDENKMRDYPDGRTFPNLFDAHPPFQIDGNFGVTAGIVEMLMQSQLSPNTQQLTPEIFLLPALPDAWKNGKVSGIKARGGFTVSINWKDGKLQSASIMPMKSGKITLRTKTPIKQGSLVKEYKDLGVYEYEINVTGNKAVVVTAAL